MCVNTVGGAASSNPGVGGKDDASSRAGRLREAAVRHDGAGTRGRWWWPQGRVIARDSLFRAAFEDICDQFFWGN